MREPPLVRALAGGEVADFMLGADQLQCGRLSAVRGLECAAPRHFDRVVERPRVPSVALDVGNGAAFEAQRDEGVVAAVVLASKEGAGEHTLEGAEGQKQEE